MKHYVFRILIIVLVATAISSGYAQGRGEKDDSSEEYTITLKQAIEIALENNRSLKQSRLNLASSRLDVEARKEDFDIKVRPSATAGFYSSDEKYWIGELEFSKKNNLGITSSITPQIERNGETYKSSVNVALNVPLFNGFGTEKNLDELYSSLYDLENAKRSYHQQKNNIILNTVSTVYEIIKLQQQIRLLTGQLDVLKNHLSLTRVKERTGLATTMDLYRAEIRLKEVQNELTNVNEQFDNNIDQLKDLLAKPLHGNMTVNAPVEYKPVETKLNEAVDIALANRIEIEQSQRRTEEVRRKLILAKKNILPEIDLKMNYEKYGENRSFDLTEESWSISLDGSSDIFRSNEKRTYEQAKINLQEAKIDQETEKQQIIKEVRAQINQMRKKQKLIADQRKQAWQAEGKLKLAISKFNHGLADNFDLLEAQSQTQKVKSDLLYDTIGYMVDIYRLRKVLGTLIGK